MQGVLAEGVLPGLLRDLYVGRRTGLLHVRTGEQRRSVVFRHGHIVHADTSVPGEHLGDTLVRRGLVGTDEVDRAVELALREGRRLGEVLEQWGLLDADRLKDALAGQVHEVLLKVFSLVSGSYEFEERDGEASPGGETTLKLSTGDLILEAARRVKDPELVRYALGDTQNVLAPSTDPLLRFQRITLGPTDGYILSRIDGTLTMEEVMQLSPVGREETERSLFSLLCAGVIEPVPGLRKAPEPARRAPATPKTATPTGAAPRPAAPPRIPAPPPSAVPPPSPAPPDSPRQRESPQARRQEILDAYLGLATKNHFEVLGISPGVTDVQVKEAYFRLARRFHPDAHHDRSLVDLRDKLEAVFIRLGQAYETLRNPRTRGPYEAKFVTNTPRPAPEPAAPPPAVPQAPEPERRPDPDAEMRKAQAALRQAAKRFEEAAYWEVIQLLEGARPWLKGAQKQQATLLLARAMEKNPNWVKGAEELLQELVHESPKSVDAHLELARIYQGRGMRTRAAAAYRKVLELSPEHEEAAAALQALGPEDAAPPERGGLLRRLFGRG